MAIDAHEGQPGPKDETMMQNNVTEVSRGGRSIYVGQKWGPACNYPEGSNTCLTLTYLGNDIYRVHVGFDFYIGRQAAQDILNAGSPIGANLVGEDDGPDQVRATIDLTYVQVGDGGLFAEFDTQVGSSRLNEDNGRDEVYARVQLADRFNHQTLRFTSGLIAFDF